MNLEAVKAVEWLEQDYDSRSYWTMPPHKLPDGTPVDDDRDTSVYRRGFYTEEDDVYVECGTDIECDCFQIPGYVLGLKWSKADEKHWLEGRCEEGDYQRHIKYLKKVHPYLFDLTLDERPNDLDWWKENE